MGRRFAVDRAFFGIAGGEFDIGGAELIGTDYGKFAIKPFKDALDAVWS